MKRIPAPRLALSLTWGFTFLAIVVLFISTHAVKEQYQEGGVKTGTGYARLAAEHMAGTFRVIDLTLSIISDHIKAKNSWPSSLDTGNRALITSEMVTYGEHLVSAKGVILIDTDGKVVLSSGTARLKAVPSRRFIDQMASQESQEIGMSEAFRDDPSGAYFAIVSKALRDKNGVYQGAVGVIVDLDDLFGKFYGDTSLPPETTVSLYGKNGRLLARFPQLETQLGKPPRTPEVNLLLREVGDDGVAIAKSSVDGLERAYVVRTVSGFPVRVLVSLAATQFMGVAYVFSKMVIYASLGLIIFSVVLSYFAIRRRQATDEAHALVQSAQDSLMAHVAVLDRNGVIVSINEGWREFAEANAKEYGLPVPNTGLGTNYLSICQGASGPCSGEASDVREGILGVLQGRLPSYQTVYPCHSPTEERWFQMMAAPLRTAKGGAVVSHTNITRLVAAEHALRENEQHFRTLANSGTAVIWTAGLDMGCDYFNDPWLQFTGKTFEEERGNGWTLGIHPDDLTRTMAVFVDAFSRRQPFSMDYRLRHHTGAYRWVQDSGAPRYNSLGEFIGYIGHAHDISDRKHSEMEMRKLNMAVAQSPDSILITDSDGNIEFVNHSFEIVTGYRPEEVIGKNPRLLRTKKTSPETHSDLWSSIKRGQVWRGEMTNQRKDGVEYIESATIGPVRNDAGEITHFLAIQRDITEVRRVEEENLRLSNYDPLTGLANRTMLLEQLSRSLISARQRKHQYALLIIDIDRFKTYNDARNHEYGDRLLIAVGRRLAETFRGAEVLARLASDEFALLLQDNFTQRDTSGRRAMSAADAVHTCLEAPLSVEGEDVKVTASIGIAMIPEIEDDSAQEIVRRADTALHRAKESGGNQTAFFEHGMFDLVQQRFQVERDLLNGIAAGELRLYLQPQVSADGTMVGAEALVRWQHPERGLVSPAQFIPIAEETDLIVALDVWVFQEVCKLLSRVDVASSSLRVSVNVSPRHFRQPGFVAWLKNLLLAYGTDPAQLTLEVTEGLVIDNIADVITKMNALAEMGIHLSLDDFGTGYSSLAYLKRLPINELKIDKSFVQDAPHDPNDGALVETILSVANHMRLKVVAEGVETRDQAEFLNTRAKIIHQGYLFGRPEPVETWLDHYFVNH